MISYGGIIAMMNGFFRFSRISVMMLSAAALSVIFLASPVHAQQTRVAYIDAQKLLAKMPEVKDANARFDQLKSSWQREAADMQAELERKQAEFDRRKLIMTDAERNAAELELANLKKKHTDFLQAKFNPDNGELFSQEATLMKPAYDRLTAAVHDAASDGNYDYVFDRSSKDVVMLFVNSKFDLTLPVAKRLGIESEIISTPLVSAKPGAPGQPGTPGAGTTPGVLPGTIPGVAPGTSTPGMNTQTGANNGIPNTSFPNSTTTPNTNTLQNPPNLNSGSFNPGQQPPPPQNPKTGH
ncbi:MAG TPA: OmpH family outer membrane protein [Candidatus Kapabacteria bacterium]|jgi:outer membrane protein